jgi:POT family proton-dependent oligopeptide transporter
MSITTPVTTQTIEAENHLSPEGYQTVPDHKNSGWPPGIYYIVGNEACERFSFYGMRAILQVHLTALFVAQAFAEDMARTYATQTLHLFKAGVYALPMIGALIADRWGGKYKTILYLSLLYCVGHGVLSIYEHQIWGMYIGLALIAIGAGGIKPCISANVGDQFGRSNRHLLPTIYQIFYFSINFGSFFATLLIPLLRSNAGYWLQGWFPATFGEFDPLRLGTSIAFGLPGVLMFIATLLFWMGRKKFVHVPAKPGGQLGVMDTLCSVSLFLIFGHFFLTPTLLRDLAIDNRLLYGVAVWGISAGFLAIGLILFIIRQRIQPDDGFFAITLHAIGSHLGLIRKNGSVMNDADHPLSKSWFWGPAVQKYGGKATEGPVAVFKIVSIFFLISMFWALFDQHSSTWITQAKQMDLRLWGPFEAWGLPSIRIQESQTGALNPMLVMVLIPVMALVYIGFEKLGIKTTPLRRITVGMFITAFSFVATALLQQTIDNSPANSVWWGWQGVQYLIITIAEVMVSITGLEFAYTQAPKKMKATIMGFWSLVVALGNVLVALMAGLQKELTTWVNANVVQGLSQEATFFWVFAVLSGVAAVLFGLRALVYVPKDYTQE